MPFGIPPNQITTHNGGLARHPSLNGHFAFDRASEAEFHRDDKKEDWRKEAYYSSPGSSHAWNTILTANIPHRLIDRQIVIQKP